jgi:tetratricopeptide (TPR) repeat protein
VPTAAERRAAEVRRTRAPRPPRDPDAERQAIEGRTVEQWIDEGSVRSEATEAANRAAAGTPNRRRRNRPGQVDGETVAVIRAAVRDSRHADKLIERLTQAQEALDRERFDDARRLASPLLRELPGVAAVHEVVGLAAYRSGRWKQAVAELESAQALHPTVELLPVLADGYRALRRWGDVDRVWADVRAASPAQEILAEARIVAAGADADRGDLQAALRTMAKAKQTPRRVRDHHLRQWYVLGDLYDRAGDPLEATHWFELVARHDAEFVDVADRLRALGR